MLLSGRLARSVSRQVVASIFLIHEHSVVEQMCEEMCAVSMRLSCLGMQGAMKHLFMTKGV